MENRYIIISTLVLLGFLLFNEIKRKNKSNLILRIIASSLAAIALIFIAIPISYQKKSEPIEENIAVLITTGFHKDSLEKFKNIPAFTTNSRVANDLKSVKLVSDLAGFMVMNQQFSKFHVIGNGLEDHELELIRDKNIVFHLSPIPSGLQSVNWNKNIKSGEQLVLSGHYKNSSDKSVKLLLNGLGATLDSINISAKNSQNFQLKAIPKHLDKAVYSLIAIATNDTILNEKLPVFVQTQNPLKVLILSSSPNFENKFLKNWLFDNRYSIAIRSKISKDKFSTEFSNSSGVNLEGITTGVLENFDVLISDPDELLSLSRTENLAIQNQVKDGMGLIIKADSISKGREFYSGMFESRTLVRADEKMISLNWDDYKTTKMTLGSSGLFKILPKDGNMAVVWDEQGNILVSSKLYGSGRVLLSSLNNTYTWFLGNDVKSYSSYWSKLIGNVARMEKINSVWSSEDLFPVLNQETTILLETDSDSIPLASSDGELLKFAQDPVLKFRWSAPFWPKKIGWHLLENENSLYSIPSWYYVFQKNDWVSVREIEKIKNNTKEAERSFFENKEQHFLGRYYLETIPAFYFYLLFLLSCAYLWLEAKKF